MKKPYAGFEIADWRHFRTPRNISGFYPDDKDVGIKGDRIVVWTCVIILVAMLVEAI